MVTLEEVREAARLRYDYYLFENELPEPKVGNVSNSDYGCTNNDGSITLTPHLMENYDIDTVLGVIAHERMHLLEMTIPRGEAIGADSNKNDWELWNIASDAFINEELRDLHYTLPGGVYYLSELCDSLGIEKPSSQEELYEILKEMRNNQNEDLSNEMSDSANVGSPINPGVLKDNQEDKSDSNDSAEGSGSNSSRSSEESDGEGGQNDGNKPSSTSQDSNSENSADGEDYEESDDAESVADVIKRFIDIVKDQEIMNTPRIAFANHNAKGEDIVGGLISQVPFVKNKIIPVVANKLVTKVRTIEERTYAKLNRRCPAIKGYRRSSLEVNIILDVSGSMWGDKLNNAASLAVYLNAYLASNGYRTNGYLLSTHLCKLPHSMTYSSIAVGTTSGGTTLSLVDKIRGVKILITDAEDNWTPKTQDNVIVVYDGNARNLKNAIRCDFSKGEILSQS